MNRREVEDRTILLGVTGSRAYGIHHAGSDYDYKGICIAPKPCYLGLLTFEQKDSGWMTEPGSVAALDRAEDCVVYELRKYLELAIQNNPSILEVLWLDDYEVRHPVGEILLAHRQQFLSRKCKHTFSGYAMAQIKKIETHRKWLLHPLEQCPDPQEYGLVEVDPLRQEEVNAFLEFVYSLVIDRIHYLEVEEELRRLLQDRLDLKGILKQYPLPEETLGFGQRLTQCSDSFIRLLSATQRYQQAVRSYDNYQDWKRRRNPERAALEAKVGYDTKHASHCVRLLKMGSEILRLGEIRVNREKAGDASLLRSIRNCEMSYDQILSLTEELMQDLEEAYQHSPLPASVDRSLINQLCLDLVERMGW